MVLAILEPVFAGIMVSLINKYVLNNLGWCPSCSVEEVVDEHDLEEDERGTWSSTITTISDADIHVHCH